MNDDTEKSPPLLDKQDQVQNELEALSDLVKAKKLSNNTDTLSTLTEKEEPAQPESDARSKLVKVKKKKIKKHKDEQQTTIGSRRGVETLFRNSYRAHLDLITLAATKANIMTSINRSRTQTHANKSRLPMAFLLLAVTGLLSAQTTETESITPFEKFRVSEDIYEPSGIVQLPDERLLVVEDEGARALRILTLNAKGEIQVVPIKREALLRGRGGLRSLGKLNDLEGLAQDKNGFIYAVTSYSRTEKKGRVSPSREKLVRFQIEGNQIINSALIQDLKQHMTAQHPMLGTAAKLKTMKETEGLNIEGLAFNKAGDQLWFGFRSPLKDRKAIILALENPEGVFKGETPRFTEILLDLDGSGIRGLTYDPRLQGYLILARREDKKKMPFELWFWSGDTGDAAHKIKVTGVKNLRRAEGITPIKWGEKEGIIIISDEGNARKRKHGRYILLRYDQIVIDQ